MGVCALRPGGAAMTRLDWEAARRRDRERRRPAGPRKPRTVAEQPTARQIDYLRILSQQTGVTLAAPETRSEASVQIGLLLLRKAGER
jgi:hypothetical protein